MATRTVDTQHPESPRWRGESLESGDRVDQPTFHAWYEQAPPHVRAELIGGRVIVHAALSAEHADYHSDIMLWLGTYRLATPGTRSPDNATTLLGPDSEPQPDACLIIDPTYGGTTRLERGYRAGPPELIVEVSRTTAAQDLHDKLLDYERYEVQEYAVVVSREREVRWFCREGQRLIEIQPDTEGIFRSRMFPGLSLDAPALVDGDAESLIETLRRGLATPEHAAFVADLAARRQG